MLMPGGQGRQATHPLPFTKLEAPHSVHTASTLVVHFRASTCRLLASQVKQATLLPLLATVPLLQVWLHAEGTTTA